MNEKRVASLLNEEIEFLEAEKFSNKFDKMMGKNISNKIKRILKIILPIFGGLGLLYLFPSKITLVILCLSAFTSVSIDFVKENIFPIKKKKSNIIDLNEYKKSINEDNIDELLNETEIEKTHDYYFRENHGFDIFSDEKQENDNFYDLKAENKPEWITSEMAINLAIKDIELFYDLYKIPPLNISDKEWDIFFEELSSEFIKRELFKEFFESLNIVIRFTLAKALVYEYKSLYITDFIESLMYIEKKYNNLETKITKREVLSIQKELLKRFKEINNVVEFSRIRKNIGK